MGVISDATIPEISGRPVMPLLHLLLFTQNSPQNTGAVSGSLSSPAALSLSAFRPPHRTAPLIFPETFPDTPASSDASRRGHAGESSGAPDGGPLPCLTFEVLRCTTLEEMESLVARTLGVDVNEIRLWVITQHLTDSPLAPRQLLRCAAAAVVLSS